MPKRCDNNNITIIRLPIISNIPRTKHTGIHRQRLFKQSFLYADISVKVQKIISKLTKKYIIADPVLCLAACLNSV